MKGVHLVEVHGGSLVVHALDVCNNNLTHTLAWCAEHHQPVWVYGDGSFSCWWEDVTGHHQHMDGWGCGSEFHRVVPLSVATAPFGGAA